MEKRELIEARAAFRRSRRYRNTRYRRPKWKHHTKRVYHEVPDSKGRHWRKVKISTQSPRPEGWLPPSLQSKCDHHMGIIDRYLAFLPDCISKNLVIEDGRFDMARMQDPSAHGEMYQRGPMYDAENLKARPGRVPLYLLRPEGRFHPERRDSGKTACPPCAVPEQGSHG